MVRRQAGDEDEVGNWEWKWFVGIVTEEMLLDKSGKQFLEPRNPTMGGTLVDIRSDSRYRW